MCVFNGPVFGNNDKPLLDAFVPLQYFKIVVFKDAGESRLKAVGFVLSQEEMIEDLAEEKFEVGEFRVRQRSIAAISRMLDLDFRPLIPLDRLQQGSLPESLEHENLGPFAEAAVGAGAPTDTRSVLAGAPTDTRSDVAINAQSDVRL
jgi:endonuclease G